MAALALLPAIGLAQTNLWLTFPSPATNAAPGASFAATLAFSPSNMVVSAEIASGGSVVPQSNLSLDYPLPTNAVVTLVPLTNTSGWVGVTVTGIAGSSTNTVDFDVFFRTYPPTLAPISDVTMDEDTTTTFALDVDDPDTPIGELILSAESSAPSLIDSDGMTFAFSGGIWSLTLAPKQDQNDRDGNTTLTVSVSDGEHAVSTTFQLTVEPVNDPPTITGADDVTIGDDAPATPFENVVIDDVDHENPDPEPLSLTVVLESLTGQLDPVYATFAAGETTFSATGEYPPDLTFLIQDLTVYPIPNISRPETVNDLIARITVSDAEFTVEETVTISVESINDPPSVTGGLDPDFVTEGQTIRPFFVSAIDDPDVGDDLFTLEIEWVDSAQSSLGSFSQPPQIGPANQTQIDTFLLNLYYTAAAGSMTQTVEMIDFRYKVTDKYGDVGEAIYTLTQYQKQNPPEIYGIPVKAIALNDNAPPLTVYATGDILVTVVDPDEGGQQLLDATLSQNNPALGTFELPSDLSGLTPAELTTALRQVLYRPEPGALTIGSSADTILSLTVTDITGLSAQNNNITLNITSVNNAPEIRNVPPPSAQPLLIPPEAPLLPFAGIEVANDDPQDLVFEITLDDPDKGSLTNLGNFAEVESGLYRMTGQPGPITASLTNLVYQLNPAFNFPPDDPGGTTFSLKARDYELLTTTRVLSIQVQDAPRNHLVTRALNDGEPGSLDYALAAAGNNDVITFALPAYPAVIRMPSAFGLQGTLIERNVTLKGPGANLLTISGDSNGDNLPNRRIFRVASRVTIEGVTLSHGTAGFGGAVLVQETGDLTLRYCAVVDSVATQYGGGIDVDGGSLMLEHCFVGRNRTDADSGFGGGGVSVYSDQPVVFVNTTFAQNHQANAMGDGGGALILENRSTSRDQVFVIVHCTFADNHDAVENPYSQASAVLGVGDRTIVSPRNSLFADAPSAANPDARNLNVSLATFVSQGGNLCLDSTQVPATQQGQSEAVILLDATSDLRETDPMLDALNPAGDPTPYYPLREGSPAIDHAQGPLAALDQRGVMRRAVPDAGAIEFNALRRLVINEIQFGDGGVNFIEIHVRRDSTPVNLAPYALFVDGVKIHAFAESTIIGTNTLFTTPGAPIGTLLTPGAGIVVALANAPIALTGALNPTPVVGPSEPFAPMRLSQRGVVSLGLDSASRAIARQTYLGLYMDPFTGTNLLDIADNAISLAPQFRGFALVPHSMILPGPFDGVDALRNPTAFPQRSPGGDAAGTPFGQDNAYPLAVDDAFTVTEDDRAWFDVLANDFDGDGNDRLVIVDVSTGPTPGIGDSVVTTSALGAVVSIDPAEVPLRGERIRYDPRHAPLLQQLPVGVEIIDSFHYEIVDIGSAPVEAYSLSGSNTAVTATNHRLSDGEGVTIAGASIDAYNGTFAITWVDADTFVIPVPFAGPASPRGEWETLHPRAPTSRDDARVEVRVIGVNDPPVAVRDVITNATEVSTVRIMTRPERAGTGITFASDPEPTPAMSDQNLLENDVDIDSDDTWETLRVAGVLGSVNPILDYTGAPGTRPVTVHAPAHGLTTAEEILIANYGGHPSYNGYHVVTVIDDDHFTLPRQYIDNAPIKGVWVVLNEANRYHAVTDVGATVSLTLRADPLEDHLIYDASASAFLKGLAEGKRHTNRFWYAVEDSHGAIGIGPVDVIVEGINDPPVANPDPDSLSALLPLVTVSNTLANVLESGLDLMYTLSPASGASGRTDLHVLDLTGMLAGTIVLNDFFVTDEDTPLLIDKADLLANDTDIDRADVLEVIGVDAFSREQAALTLGGGSILYDPTVSSNLQALAREEMRIDTFSVAVSDGMTAGTVTSLVAVLVIGVNDPPIANPVFHVTNEDERFVFDPRDNDIEIDIDGHVPDDRLRIVAVTNLYNPGLARVDLSTTNVVHDATVSDLLNQLADWQSFTNVFAYTITDNSFLFAVDDIFHVPADSQDRVLEVLANDRDYTDSDGLLTIIDAGPTLHGGLVSIPANGTHLVYSPPAGFVGEDVFRYTIRNDKGDVNSGRATVRAVVPPLNGILMAADDHYTVAAGETIVMDVTANDNMLPLSGAELTVTALVSTSLPGQPSWTATPLSIPRQTGLRP